MRIKYFLFWSVALAICSVLACPAPGALDFSKPDLSLCVIPQPRQIEMKNLQPVHLHSDWVILLESTATDSDRDSAKILRADLKEIYGLDIPVVTDDTLLKDRRNAIILGLPKRDVQLNHRTRDIGLFVQQKMGREGYVLDVNPDVIYIIGNDSAGVYYGVQTLRQLVTQTTGEILLPALTIRDAPTYPWRGYQLDISRSPLPKMDYLKQVIQTLGAYKINLLTLYTEPQAVKFAKYPKLGDAAALTPDEITELVQYAQCHHIELVGNFQSFGHWDKVLSAQDKDVVLDESNPSVLSPQKERTYEILKNLYDELVPLYPSRFFMVNCDNAGIVDEGALWLAHLNRLQQMLFSYNKQVMVWSMVPEKSERIIPNLPYGLIIMSGGTEEDYYKKLSAFRKASALTGQAESREGKDGLSQFVCPAAGATNQVFPRLSQSFPRIYQFIRKGSEMMLMPNEATPNGGIMGMMLVGSWQGQGEDWTELEWYPILWAAECAWLPDRVNETNFRRKFTRGFYGGGTDEAMRLFDCLEKPAELLGDPVDLTKLFWEDPFASRFHLTLPDFPDRLDKIGEVLRQVTVLNSQLKEKARRHRDSLEYLSFALQRWQFLLDKFRLSRQLMAQYRQTYAEWRDVRQVTLTKLDEMTGGLAKLSAELANLKTVYLNLSSRIYRPSLEKEVLARFQSLGTVYQSKTDALAALRERFTVTGKIPSPETLDFQEKTFPDRVVSPPVLPAILDMTKIPVWWNNQWNYRVLIRIENSTGGHPRFDYPVVLTLNFSELLRDKGIEAEWDKNSLRVIEYKADDSLDEVPSQFDPGANFNTKHNAVGSVAWIAGGEWLPRTSRSFYLYFDTLGAKPKPVPAYRVNGLTTYAGKDGACWVENERMKVEILPLGGRLTQWWVKKSDKQLVQTSDADHSGFAILPGETESDLKLLPQATGPIFVRYQLSGAGGVRGTINFFHNLPLAEVILNYGTETYADYDNLWDKNRSAKYLFSNYYTGQVPAKSEGELNQSITDWVIRFLPDGLAAGGLTPDNRVTHYVRWDGFGMTSGTKTVSHFILFADRVAVDPYHLLNRWFNTFNLSDAPTVRRGEVETGP